MDFLEEVMRGKGFPETRINIIMDTVTRGKVCINVNGSRSPFFNIFRGQRHAEHHGVFNLDADALSVMLEKAVHHGRIVGILPDLIQGGISHSHTLMTR
jgi:hypothetical protein